MQCATPQARVRAVQTHAPDKYEKKLLFIDIVIGGGSNTAKIIKG